MNHNDHVRLLDKGIHAPDGVWADLGSGRGAFTLALAQLLTPSAQIHSVDHDPEAIRIQRDTLQARFPNRTFHYHIADFSQPIEFPPLDGIIMANALHFFRDKKTVLRLLRSYLKDSGRLILVEYNTDQGNRWVPYPLSYTTWQRLAADTGLGPAQLLHKVPSSFLGEFYSACSEKGT